MNLRSFLKLVEIQTKIASVFPYLLGTAYVLYRYQDFDWLNGLIMFGAMLCFDMATTAINNYIDFQTAIKREGYGYEEHNAMGRDGIAPKAALRAIAILLILAVAGGLLLFWRTQLNIVVLGLGMACFGMGVLYTFGPIPISRTPLGEVLSGFTMGFIITFLAVYIHVYDSQLVLASYATGTLLLAFDLPELCYLLLFALPAIVTIANIMLTNNICDMEDDLANGRKTLPLVIGKKRALYLFGVLYALGYVSVLALVLLGIMPVYYLAGLLSAIVVYKNVKVFNQKHVKAETFILAIRNFLAVNSLNLVLVCVALAFAGKA